jgi:hypothetical protein
VSYVIICQHRGDVHPLRTAEQHCALHTMQHAWI